MNYTFESLVEFISRNDEHKKYYIEQLRELMQAEKAEAWDEGNNQAWEDCENGAEFGEPNPYRGGEQR